MRDRLLVAFDIETIPDPDLGRSQLGLTGDDAAVVRQMVERQRAETNGRSDYPQLPWHRVVSACVTTLDPRTGEAHVRALGGALLDERSHVEGFFRLAEATEAPRLVSWNGSGFDLPVLRYRAMKLGVAAAGFHRVGEETEGARRGYASRYDDLHVDLMDVLSGWGASSRVGLSAVSRVLGLPGKSFLERPVWEHVVAGEAERVVAYNQLDTVLTMLAFVAWAFHAGHLDREEVRRSADAVARAVAGLPYAGFRALDAELAAWPAWAR